MQALHEAEPIVYCYHIGYPIHAHLRLRVSADSAAGQFALLSKQYTSQNPSAPRHPEIFYMLESLMR